MLTIQQINRRNGLKTQLPIPIEATVELKVGLDHDSAVTIWSVISHTQLIKLFEDLDRDKYAFNLRHEQVENSYGHWYPVTFEPVVKAGGYIVSVVWRRWDDTAALEEYLPKKITARLRREVQTTSLISFGFFNLNFILTSTSPFFYWNLVLASAPPFNHYSGSDPIVPRYAPYPALEVGTSPVVTLSTSVPFLLYSHFALGLIEEIQSDVFKDEDQNFSDVLKQLREYQLAVSFTTTDWTLIRPITAERSYDILPTLPSASSPRHILTRQLLANELTYTAPLDNKYTRPITCVYDPTNNYVGSDKKLGTTDEPSNSYEYTDRPKGYSDTRTPLRVKHPQKSRERAILECHLQRYKLLEEYNRINFKLTLDSEWHPLDTFIIPSDLYHTEEGILGVVLGTTHSYPRKGARLTTINAKLFPQIR